VTISDGTAGGDYLLHDERDDAYYFVVGVLRADYGEYNGDA